MKKRVKWENTSSNKYIPGDILKCSFMEDPARIEYGVVYLSDNNELRIKWLDPRRRLGHQTNRLDDIHPNRLKVIGKQSD